MTKKLTEQLTLATGKQDCVCPICGGNMTATVGGRVKKNANRQTYKDFKGSCRHCRSIFSGILKTHNY